MGNTLCYEIWGSLIRHLHGLLVILKTGITSVKGDLAMFHKYIFAFDRASSLSGVYSKDLSTVLVRRSLLQTKKHYHGSLQLFPLRGESLSPTP